MDRLCPLFVIQDVMYLSKLGVGHEGFDVASSQDLHHCSTGFYQTQQILMKFKKHLSG